MASVTQRRVCDLTSVHAISVFRNDLETVNVHFRGIYCKMELIWVGIRITEILIIECKGAAIVSNMEKRW